MTVINQQRVRHLVIGDHDVTVAVVVDVVSQHAHTRGRNTVDSRRPRDVRKRTVAVIAEQRIATRRVVGRPRMKLMLANQAHDVLVVRKLDVAGRG